MIRYWTLWLLIIGAVTPGFFTTSVAGPNGSPFVLKLGRQRVQFHLERGTDVQQLEQKVKIELSRLSDEDAPAQSSAEKRERRGLREIQRLSHQLAESTNIQDCLRLEKALRETSAAIENLSRAPLPERVDFFETPLVFLERFSRPVGVGNKPASNLNTSDSSDMSLSDPTPSTFWRRPASVSDQDLFHGFGRTHELLEPGHLCTYSGPKESFGRNPGFEVECEGERLKIKFAEVSSEPFAARMFYALGFHVDPTDYAESIRVRYSRRIFLEFNLRKPLKTHFTFLGLIPLFTLELQQHYDAFDYISSVALTNGARWSAREFKQHLLINPSLPFGETNVSNFRPEVEAAVEFVETKAASVQLKIGKSIGPWDFGQLDHPFLREIRGAGLLAAWLGWFDTRFDNTRVRVTQNNGRHEVEHYFSDLGGVLGETTGLLYSRGELPNAFPWIFTRPPLYQGAHHLARPLRIQGYKPIAPTPAFAAMTVDDARWMARLIAALSQNQIQQALVASGFDSSQACLYLAKLMNRRNRMIADLGLENEIPVTNLNTHFSYNPATDGPFRAKLADGFIEAPRGTNCIVNGRLAPLTSRGQVSAKKARSAPNAFSF